MTDPNANDDPDLQRHMDEVALLQAMYPEDEFVTEPSAVGLTVDITLGGTYVDLCFMKSHASPEVDLCTGQFQWNYAS